MIITEARSGQMDDPTAMSKVIENSDAIQINSPIKEPVKNKVMSVFSKKKVKGAGAPELNTVDHDGVTSLAVASKAVVGVENAVAVVEATNAKASKAKPKGSSRKNHAAEPRDPDMESAVTSLSMASISVVQLGQGSLEESPKDTPKKDKFMKLFKKKEKEEAQDDTTLNPIISEDPKTSSDQLETATGETAEKSKNHFRNLFTSKKKDQPQAPDKLEEETMDGLEITEEDIEMALSSAVKETPKNNSVMNIFKKRSGSVKYESPMVKSESTDSLRSGSEHSETTPIIASEEKAKETSRSSKSKSNLKHFFSKNKSDPLKDSAADEEMVAGELVIAKEEEDQKELVLESSNKFTSLFNKKKKTVPSEDHHELQEIDNPDTIPDEQEESVEKVKKEKSSIFGKKKKIIKEQDLPTESLTGVDNQALDPESENIPEDQEQKDTVGKSKKEKSGIFGKKKKIIKDQESTTEHQDDGYNELVEDIIEDHPANTTEEDKSQSNSIKKEAKEKTSIFKTKKKVAKDTTPLITAESLDNLENEACEEKLTTKEKSKLGSLFNFSHKKKVEEAVEGVEPEAHSNDLESHEEEALEPIKRTRKSSIFKRKNKKKEENVEETEDGGQETNLTGAEKSIEDQQNQSPETESTENLVDANKDDEEDPSKLTEEKPPKEKSSFFTLKKKKKVKEESVLTTANSVDCLESVEQSTDLPMPTTLDKSKKDKSSFFHRKNKSEADLGALQVEEDLGTECPIKLPIESKVKAKKVSIFSKKKNRPVDETNEPEAIVANEEVSSSSYELDHEVMDFTPLTIPNEVAKSDKPKSKLKTFSDMMIFASTRPLKRMEPLALADVPAKDGSRNEDNELEIAEDRMLLEDSQSAVKLLNETLEPSSESNITIEAQMQLLCDLFGHKEDVIWDSYTPNQREALKNKLKLVLDPETKSKKKNIEKFINDMADTIWNQSKYSDGVLNMSILFVALLNEKELDVRKATNFTLRPVFRTTKCYDKDSRSSKGCCMIFIDESGRVYRNWDHFIVENTYEPSIIVAPSRGIFNTDAEGKVCMEFFTAPSSSVGAKLLSITDKTATVTGLGASACFIGGMLTVALLPVAAPAIGIAMAGAGLVGAASAGYSMVRSTQKMKDMSEHEKSLKITDAEARGHWLGLIGGMTGFVSGVASHGIDILARSGTHIPAFFRGSIDAINAASIAVNGVGVIDGFSTMFLKWNEEKISTMEIMQLSASLFMFTHSMYNFETANTIIKNHHNMTVNEFRDKLGQNQRHHYHKMAKESLKVHGKGHRDVIRSLRAIPDQQEFHKMHKAENVITEGMATAATLLVAKFCKSYFVVDENDLLNTILNAMTLLSDHAFDVFMDVVERFVECKGELVQKSLRGMISFEEVMSDILTSVTSISESLGLDASEFIETLTKTESFLASLIDRIYDIYKDYERVEPNQTCAECKGVFTVKMTASGKSSSSSS